MATVKRRADRGNRWQAHYVDPAGKQHRKLFDRKVDADRWLDGIRGDMAKGTYVDPRAGRQLFSEYAEEWKAAQVQHRPATASLVAGHLKNHILPGFEARALAAVRRSEVQAWVTSLTQKKLAPSTVELIYGYCATIFRAAVEDGKLAVSPCRGIKLPEVEVKRIVPLATESVKALIEAMPGRYRALVVVGAGTGLRQGEAFGLSVPHVDFLRRDIVVAQQVTLAKGGAYIAPLKTKASYRNVPASAVVVDALAGHLAEFPARDDGIIFTNAEGGLIRRQRFNEHWKEAVKAAKLPAETHFHELRHFYASLLIHRGASVKVVQARLGHASATETLDTYGHLWPDSEDATRAAVDDVLGPLLHQACTTDAAAT